MKKLTLLTMALIILMSGFTNSAPKQRYLVEEHTGAWCPPCGSTGKPAMEALITKYPDDVISVELHNASPGRVDPMAIPEQQTIAAAFGLPGFPYGSINRMMFYDGQKNVFFIYPTQWDGVIAQLIPTADPVVEVKLFYAINSSTRALSATVEATFLKNYTPAQGGELRFNVYVLEDNIIYPQAGNLSNYNHQNTCRTMLGGAWGTNGVIPNSVTAGQTFTYTYDYTLNSAWGLDNLHFVGIVQEYHTQYADVKKILNCVRGSQGNPYSELTTTGSSVAVKPVGTPFAKTFSLRNITNEQITFRINDEVSDRTPSDWTWTVNATNGIVSKSNETQTTEITLNAGLATDVTIELTPGATLGIGDLSIEVLNKYDPTGQKSSGSIKVVSAEIENLQIKDFSAGSYSVMNQMASAGLTGVVELSGDEFSEVGIFMNNLSTVVWNCGDDGDIASSEVSTITSAISEGTNMLIMGGKMGSTINANASSLLSYLGVQWLAICRQGSSTQGAINLVGYPGDPITDNMNLGAKIYYFTQALKVTGSTTYPILKHMNTDTVVATRTILDDTRVVFVPTNPFYVTNSYDRDNFLKKAIEWLQGIGPTISCAEEMSFASTEAGQTSQQTLTLTNSGKSALNITDVEVEYDYSANFKLIGDKTFSVPAGGTYDLVVEFKPSYAIQYDSWIRIYSNAENDPIKQVNVSGTGTKASAGPVVSLSISEVSFVDVSVGGNETRKFTVNNTGNQDLEVTNITVPGAYSPLFTIEPTSFTVAAGAGQEVDVTFVPMDVLSIETNITISSNNKDGVVQLPLTANSIVGVEDGTSQSALLNLFAGPNPFSENAKIEFTLNGDMSQQVEIVLIDATGRTVKAIDSKLFEPGTYNYDLNSSDMTSGTYYIIAKTNDYKSQLQIVVVK